MKSKSFHGSALASKIRGLGLVVVLAVTPASAGEKVLFPMSAETAGPYSALIADNAGNFYGVAGAAGVAVCNPQIYQLSRTSSGRWKLTVIYQFQNCGQNALDPRGDLAIDKNGNLYGAQYSIVGEGSGQIYELKKQSDGTFRYGVLHNFPFSEGAPFGSLTFDAAGNIYGATFYDSTGFDGEVFELSPQGNGMWKETILYTFNLNNPPAGPVAGVAIDSQGNLYGPTYYGPDGSYGAIYELSPQPNGPWKLTTLYNFKSNEASELNSKLVFDAKGNLYGTSIDPADGQVFKLSPSSGGGPWTETVLHSFSSGSDGRLPVGTLVFDNNGNLYGATSYGGTGCNQNLCGVVYELSPQAGGSWKETIRHQFESAEDGSQPPSGVILDNAGNIYGTTYHGGGRYGYGTVYEITP